MQPLSPLDWIDSELAQLEKRTLLRGRRTVRPLPGGRCEIDGRVYWNLSSNDYLDLAGDSRLIEAAKGALDDAGTGSRASPLVTGRTSWHEELERRLAQFKHGEAALLFPSGYTANVGTICALVGPGDDVYCDRLNHASLVDGCRLSRARLQVYPHGHVRELRRLLERPSKCRRRLIVTDSLFSMDGDIAPLAELGELSEEFNAMLLVDEAHATGVFGDRGTGLAEATWENKGRQVPAGLVCVGTLSKALGSQGGFVVGSQRDIAWLWNSSRTQMFSTALTPASCAAALAALDIIEQEPWRRQKLTVSSQALAKELRASGLNVAESVAGPVIPVILGDSEQVLQAAGALESEGFLAGAIRPPTVPTGTSRLRISITCSYEQALSQEVARILSSKTATPTPLRENP